MARNKMRGHDTLVYEPKLSDAVRFIRGIDEYLADYVELVHQSADIILVEIAGFDAAREVDPDNHARTAVIFALLSPQCKFGKNVAATRRLLAHLHDRIDLTIETYGPSGPYGKGTYYVELVNILTDSGRDNFMSAKPASVRIAQSLAYLRGLKAEDMTLSAIIAAKKAGVVVGLADKTMRMALHLFDATLPVYTLDVHMLRGVQTISGGVTAASMSASGPTYAALEAAMLDWHGRNFPNLPPFVSQWALWNEWGFGRHVSHVGIFV